MAFQPPLRLPPPQQLPAASTTLNRPFECVGLDHTRPIKTDTGVVYLLLIICKARRAVYLDIDTLKADVFILMLRRFAASHGTPSRIYSDNATTFRAADTFLREIYHQEETQQYLRNTCITWHFQTPRSPWKGGFFERMIGVVKRTLKTTLRRNIFHPEQVRTLVKEAEAVISNHPVMYSGDERDI
ncbi:uncharacterized protein [Macrobrachium rosenbergii]|uniref:uncharacterized protein n=1 Tax=Macrobrachium rosenbergii TaxID=79674 RepID=UPI0034D734C3